MKVRIRYGKNKREIFDNVTEQRAAELRTVAAQLVKAKIDPAQTLAFLHEVARATEADLVGLRAHVAASVKRPETRASKVVTFAQLAKEWTSGKLARDWPDHVGAKKQRAEDGARVAFLNNLDVADGLKLGAIPLTAFRLDHAEKAMRMLPETAKRPATRRHYAQVMRRVLELAVYPLRLIAQNPIPKGFMPRTGKPPGFSYLYPNEDAALMASGAPIEELMLFGVAAREGMRAGELIALRWLDVDLERGVITLDRNKTDDARAWALDAGVARALTAWHARRKPKPADLVFPDADGLPFQTAKLASALRARLWAAGVRRPELHESGENRRQLRFHDLRGTFVTLSLAAGRSEAWVQDRTGHTTSAMLNRYRRAARSAQELELGAPLPLDQAIDELCQRRPTRLQWKPELVAREGGHEGGHIVGKSSQVPALKLVENLNDSAAVPKVGLEPTRLLGQRILRADQVIAENTIEHDSCGARARPFAGSCELSPRGTVAGTVGRAVETGILRAG